MMTTSPILIVSLPARSVAEAVDQIEEARLGGADAAEIRFDRWPDSERTKIAQLFPSRLPLVATLRSKVEGGEGPDDRPSRQGALADYATLPFAFLDRELLRDPLDGPAGSTTLKDPPEPTIIVSRHFLSTPASAEVRELLRRAPVSGQILKIVFPSGIEQLFREFLPELLPPGELVCVVHTTGASGPLLRAWSRRYHFPLVFAALPESIPRHGQPRQVEPAQIPVDRLRRFFDRDPPGPIYAVIGHPIAHSWSPALHSRWMGELGHSGLYVALDVRSDEEFVSVLPLLFESGVVGVNVTHPFKSVAVEVADEVRRGAEACGCANTLTFRRGEIEAENTDLTAILRRLEELKDEGQWNGRELTILGSGGAARATIEAARSMGAAVRIAARNPETAKSLVEHFGVDLLELPTKAPSDLVVNATPIGRLGTGGIDRSWETLLRRNGYLLDFVYTPEEPLLSAAAGRAGAAYEDGWRLLVYQAAAAYSLWWPDAPTEDSLRALIQEGVWKG